MRALQQIAELVLDHTVKMVLKPLYDIYICISAIISETIAGDWLVVVAEIL
jgi:hypothetical protein